jgi:hypothetical protein
MEEEKNTKIRKKRIKALCEEILAPKQEDWNNKLIEIPAESKRG